MLEVEQGKETPFPRPAPPFQSAGGSERFHRRGEATRKKVGIERQCDAQGNAMKNLKVEPNVENQPCPFGLTSAAPGEKHSTIVGGAGQRRKTT